MINFDTNLTLDTALANAVKSLADFFGTTTEAIMGNAPSFLNKYGWYCTLTALPSYLCQVALIIVAFTIVFFLFNLLIDDHMWLTKKTIKYYVFGYLGIIVISCIIFLLPVIVTPELVGLDYLVKVMTGNN